MSAAGFYPNVTVELEAIKIGAKAWEALLEEVYTTPKPGLVDLYSNGAHTDMDVTTFEKSAAALRPYFVRMAWEGLTFSGNEEELFLQIRKTGQAAEKAMFQVTDNVNTHKGLIFTLGIYCGAAGRCIRHYGKVKRSLLQKIQIKMTESILKKEAKELLQTNQPASHGEKNLCQYGTLGIRGEAIKGYPSLWSLGLPVLEQGKKDGKMDWNLVKIHTLLCLMAETEDSNILSRHNPEELFRVQQEAKAFLEQGGVLQENAVEKLLELDREYQKRNISAGGCADLLAASIFLHMILEEETIS